MSSKRQDKLSELYVYFVLQILAEGVHSIVYADTEEIATKKIEKTLFKALDGSIILKKGKFDLHYNKGKDLAKNYQIRFHLCYNLGGFDKEFFIYPFNHKIENKLVLA